MLRFLKILTFLLLLAPEAASARLAYSVTAETEGDRFYRILAEGGRRVVFAEGEIEVGDADRLEQFLAAEGIDAGMIVFDSPGGSLLEGLKLGRKIRELRHDTGIEAKEGGPAICASACAYAFAGGINRYYSEESGRLGIHQFYGGKDEPGAERQAQEISGLLVAYLTSMGVDALAFSVSTQAGAEEMVWLSEADATDLGFANNGVQPTWAELKMSGMRPYLKIEQERREGHGRVLFLCGDGQLHIMAGVVTDPDQSAFHSSISVRSYIELDGQEFLVKRAGGTSATDSVLWLERELDLRTVQAMLRASKLDIWTEGGGAVRWGGGVDLAPVRQKIREYAVACLAGE